MIHYVTSPALGYTRSLAYARKLVRRIGTGTATLVEEPVHLSPREQTAWADRLLWRNGKHGGRCIVVASILELPILRLLRRIREGDLDPSDFVTHVISSAGADHTLRAGDDGNYLDPWPDGFFDERMAELF